MLYLGVVPFICLLPDLGLSIILLGIGNVLLVMYCRDTYSNSLRYVYMYRTALYRLLILKLLCLYLNPAHEYSNHCSRMNVYPLVHSVEASKWHNYSWPIPVQFKNSLHTTDLLNLVLIAETPAKLIIQD